MSDELLSTTSFERHGIKHLSASTAGMFVAEPALFVLQKLFKLSTPVGAAAHRGTAVEDGILHGLFNLEAPLEDCQGIALAKFDSLCNKTDPKYGDERKGIPGMVLQGINRLRPRGIPSSGPRRIDVVLPDVPIPWQGYLDLFYEQHSCTLDIKTTHRVPSKVSVAHARQVSLYTYGTNYDARVAYISPSKSEIYKVEDKEQHILDLINIAQRMERFLALSDDKHFLASFVCPDYDSYYYSNRETREMARGVFGL